jgi:Fe-S oxidoreductase
MMTDPELKQNRLDWVDEDIHLSTDSDTIYFVGCLPYYDAAFEAFNFEGLRIANAALRILNSLGIEPILLAEERCCGHDQYWQGDMDTFFSLAGMNLDLLQGTGAKRIVTTCPECSWTLKRIYADTVGDMGMEVVHLTELLAESDLPEIQKQPQLRVTYQDPCRLGRYAGIYDPPRDLLVKMGFNLQEMTHNRNASLCCGTSCWSTCGQVNKQIQIERLREAASTGAEILITTCQKCQIHFRCAQRDPVLEENLQINIQDLTTLLADCILDGKEK